MKTKPLLGGRLRPITNTMGFLETDLASAVDGYLRWMGPIQAQRGVRLDRRSLGGGLEDALRALAPLTSVEARRFLFMPTAGKWTAFFDNGHRGTDAFPPMSQLARVLATRGARVVATAGMFGAPSAGDTEAAILEVYGPHDGHFLNYVRSLSVSTEGGRWKFDAAGTPFPFEDAQAHKAAKVRDRFSVDLLARYCEALGVRPFDDEFYRSDEAVLIEKRGAQAPGLQEFQLTASRPN